MLSVARKVYSRILTERVMEITDENDSEEQGGFRKGRGCVHQIFALNMVVEYWRKIENCMQPSWTWRKHVTGLTGKLFGTF